MLSQSNDQIELLEKIKQKRAIILILGLGQVGLPTAIAFLESGYTVRGFDINKSLVEKINCGVSPIPERDFDEIITKHLNAKAFLATDSADAILKADVVVVCVATPLNVSRTNADLSGLKQAITNVGEKMNNIKLVIIESTIPPGTMKSLVIPEIEKITMKKSGIDFLVSFCPERISPGNALREFSNNSRLIGAEDGASHSATFELLSRVTMAKLFQTDTTTAEVCKLAENSFRDVNIAFANELALICKIHDVKASEVIKLANSHPRVNIHSPGPGVGGPCLPKDPYLLLVNFKSENSVIRTARWINDRMPDHVVNLVVNKSMGEKGIIPDDFSILILGSSYKANVNDARNSPTEIIVRRLKEKGFTDVTVHDPYSSETFGANSTTNLEKTLSRSKFVVLVTAHTAYSSLKPQMFHKQSVVLDAVGLFNREVFTKRGLQYISIG